MDSPKRRKVLIVDDSSDMRRSLRRLLESQADWMVCGEAANGLEGVEKAKSLIPDAVILDMSMPVMGGIEAAHKLKSAVPSIPVILFTNFTEELFLTRHVSDAGIKQVVSKSDARGLLAALAEAA